MNRLFCVLFVFSLCPMSALCEDYSVILKDKQGNIITIGSAHINDDKVGFEKDESVFKDFFLSMKEMKCLEGPEIWCHIPYPYAIKDVNKNNQLQWLSHQMLFMYKRPDQFGAQLWQGVYFDLSATEDGFDGIAYSVDLNELASPPDDLSSPPIQLIELDPLETDGRWLPFMQLQKH